MLVTGSGKFLFVTAGGADFTVRLWDLYSGALIHTFAVHGGMVKDIIACPPEINVCECISLDSCCVLFVKSSGHREQLL